MTLSKQKITCLQCPTREELRHELSMVKAQLEEADKEIKRLKHEPVEGKDYVVIETEKGRTRVYLLAD